MNKMYKIFEFEKGSRDRNYKIKETSSQFESVRISYLAIMHQPVTICSTMQSNACTNKSIL